MKKTLAAFLFLLFVVSDIYAQDDVRGRALGISFTLTDYSTAQFIRNGTLSTVIREKQWSQLKEMAPGIAVTYFKGLKKHIDFAATINATYVRVPLENKPPESSDNLLVELDASANFKMFSDSYWFTPYIIVGVGASKYKEFYGAFIPVGGGFKVNFYDEAALFITSQYRVPVISETNNYHFFNSIGIAGTIGQRKAPAVRPAP
jgi:OOP family OmpA-OmpF porin